MVNNLQIQFSIRFCLLSIIFLSDFLFLFGSDVDKLSSAGEVEFVCRSCAYNLTKKPIRYYINVLLICPCEHNEN
jgi:hypothetical protein